MTIAQRRAGERVPVEPCTRAGLVKISFSNGSLFLAQHGTAPTTQTVRVNNARDLYFGRIVRGLQQGWNEFDIELQTDKDSPVFYTTHLCLMEAADEDGCYEASTGVSPLGGV